MFTRLLCNSAESGDLRRVKSLVLGRGVNPNFACTDRDGRTPLHFAAERLHYDIILFLTRNGANPDVSDRFGFTPLARACLTLANLDDSATVRGHIKLLQVLLDSGARYKSRDKFGNSIVHLLASRSKAVAFDIICRHIAVTELIELGQTDNVDVLNLDAVLLSLYYLPGWGLLTPLHMAAESSNAETLGLMLQTIKNISNKTNQPMVVNLIDAIGWAPLHWAALRNNTKVVDLLLGYGAHKHQMDYVSRTPLDVALTFQRTEMACKLLETPAHSSPANSARSPSTSTDPSTLVLSGIEPTKTPSARHFCLISASLMTVICSAAEFGLRQVCILSNPPVSGSALMVLTVPTVLVLAVVMITRQIPSRILASLPKNGMLAYGLDAVILLCLLVPIKCGPLMLAHNRLVSERGIEQLVAVSIPVDTPPRCHHHHSDSKSLLRRTQRLWLRPFKLLNRHKPPSWSLQERCICPPFSPPAEMAEVCRVRAELRDEWIELYHVLESLCGSALRASFSKDKIEAVDTQYLMVCLWFLQMLLPSTWKRPSNNFPTGTTVPTSNDNETIIEATASAEASSERESGSSTSNQIVSDFQNVASDYQNSEFHNAASDFHCSDEDLYHRHDSSESHGFVAQAKLRAVRGIRGSMVPASSPQNVLMARTPMEDQSDTRSPLVKWLQGFTRAEHFQTPPSGSDSDSSRMIDQAIQVALSENEDLQTFEEQSSSNAVLSSSAMPSSSEQASSGEEPPSYSSQQVNETDTSEQASSAQPSSAQPSSALPSSEQRTSSPFESSEPTSSAVRSGKLGDTFGGDIYTPHFGETEIFTQKLLESPIAHPILAPFANRAFQAESIWPALRKWFREFQKIGDFLGEKPVLNSAQLSDLSTSQVLSPRFLMNVFLRRRLDPVCGLNEFAVKLTRIVDIDFAGSDDSTKQFKSEATCQFDRVLMMLQMEAAELPHVQVPPPFVDLDVLNRKRQMEDLREVTQDSTVSISVGSSETSSEVVTPSKVSHMLLATSSDKYTKAFASLILVPGVLDLLAGVIYVTQFAPNEAFWLTLVVLLALESMALLIFSVTFFI